VAVKNKASGVWSNALLEYLYVLTSEKPHGYKRKENEEGGMQSAAVGLKRYKMAVCACLQPFQML
jgi:hypothetical protein